MANDVEANINLTIAVSQKGTNDLGVPTFAANIDQNLRFTGGTDAITKANILFSDSRTLGASATENLDLAGVLVGPLGDTITAAEIVAIYISAASANTNDVIIGNVTNGFPGPLGATGTYTLSPGEFVLMSSKNGWPVTAGTGDLIKVANSAGTTGVTYSIMIIGRSTAA